MAKLKGPLFSLGASGKLADTIVFFPWKGLNVAREYIIPSNPKTALQTTQRAYMTAAVAMVHTAQARATHPLNSDDQVAYSALASAKGKIMTWFNQACKLWVDVKVAGATPCVYSDGETVNKAHANCVMEAYLNEETPSDLAAGHFYWGTSKTNLINAVLANVPGGTFVNNGPTPVTTMTAGIKYYWQFRPDALDPCEGADSGIYSFVAT